MQSDAESGNMQSDAESGSSQRGGGGKIRPHCLIGQTSEASPPKGISSYASTAMQQSKRSRMSAAELVAAQEVAHRTRSSAARSVSSRVHTSRSERSSESSMMSSMWTPPAATMAVSTGRPQWRQ